MGLRFIGQPFAGGGQIGRVLSEALREPDASTLWIATAWAKRSGVGRIRDAAADFHAAGGQSEVIVGIDEGGATSEGLQLCLDLFDQVFVYHDPGARTFHPKIYAVESSDRSTLLVGSGNLTKGGLYTNYEATIVIDAVRGHPEWSVRDDVRAYFEALLHAGDAIRPLNPELIDLLAHEGWVVSEARQNRRHADESQERRQRQRLFGSAVGGLAGAPAPGVPPLPDEDEDVDSPLPPAPPTPPTTTTPAPPAPPTPPLPPAPSSSEALLIEVRPHHNGEIFLSKRAVDQRPAFFGFPFTGWTTPTRAGNAPYPMASPDPQVELVVHDTAGRVILRVEHSLNVVFYERKGEIRITIPPEPLARIPQMSLLVMTRAPAAGRDYRLDFYPPDCVTPDVNALRARLTNTVPTGGAAVARRFGWTSNS